MLLITNGVMVSGSSELSCRDQIRSHMTVKVLDAHQYFRCQI